MKISKDTLRTFFCSVAGTILFIVLVAGFVIVEKNTRAVAFGDNSPFLVCKREKILPSFVKVHFMGKDYIYGN